MLMLKIVAADRLGICLESFNPGGNAYLHVAAFKYGAEKSCEQSRNDKNA